MTTYCINLSNQQVTEYTGFDALAFERIGDKYYAVCADGIYIIGNGEVAIANDNGTEIDAIVKLGMTDLKSANLKRIPYVYIGVFGTVSLQMLIDDNGVTPEYNATHSRAGNVTSKIKVGKGIKSRYWQPIIRNVDGEYFEIDSLELLPDVLRRRVT